MQWSHYSQSCYGDCVRSSLKCNTEIGMTEQLQQSQERATP